MDAKRIKYPRTYHLPWSPGVSSDDKVLDAIDVFKDKNIVITEKMDGENTTIAKKFTHARSINSGYHESRTWIKRIHGAISHLIPENMRIHGENLMAIHSIEYNSLPSYFLVFAISVDDLFLSWQETEDLCMRFGLYTVPVLYKGSFVDINKFKVSGSKYGTNAEGYVVRNSDSFEIQDMSSNIAKYVRKGHVQTEQHWMHKRMERNGLVI